MTQQDTASVEDLLVNVSQELTTLATNLDLVETLTNSRKPRILGFATHEGKLAQDQQLRKERSERRQHSDLAQMMGLAWMRRETLMAGTGEVITAGNAQAVSLAVDFHITLQHALRRCLRSITGRRPAFLRELRGLGVLNERDTALVAALDSYAATINLDPTTSELVDELRHLSWFVTEPHVLSEVFRDIEHLNEAADRFLDGTDRTRLKAPCPHCGRNTLVVYFEDGIVRCEKDPHTGRFEDCVCPEPICDCKNNPHHRHEWIRSLGTAPGSWWKLADRINLTTTK